MHVPALRPALRLVLGLAAALMLTASPGQAAPLLFSITGAYEASFVIDDHPDAVSEPSSGHLFYVQDVPGTFDGREGTALLAFYDEELLGGLGIAFFNPDTSSYDILGLWGRQLFTGSVTSPALFAFESTRFDDLLFPGDVYFVSARPVPEPASWLLLIGGFGFMGMALRRRAATFPFARRRAILLRGSA